MDKGSEIFYLFISKTYFCKSPCEKLIELNPHKNKDRGILHTIVSDLTGY